MAGVDLAVPTLLVLLHLVPRTVAGTTDDEAAAALLAFKRASVSADPHGALSGWRDGTSASPCAWAGVSCAATDGRVRALNLSGMSLAGRLHLGALLALPALRSLDLRGNAFHGNLSHRASPSRRIAPPPCALVDVDLSSNALKGALPWAFLASCGNLRSLNLSRNSLSGGGFPFPPSLRTLDMSRNNFSGDISVFLGGFQQLKKLALAGNNFTGEIPDELGLLSGTLVELDLSSNQLIGGLPPSFSRCRSLMVLDLSGNQLSGDFVVTVISKISSLRVLRLPFNNITGRNPLPTLVAGCPLLEVIDLGSNMLNGEIMPELCSSLPSLRKLLLPNNFLTGTVPLSLGICSNLESLDLSFNLLVGQIPAEVILLPKLVDLAMWANDLSGEIPDMLCSSSITLETLVLSYNHFTGGIPASITRCVNLIWVSLAGNSLTGSVPSGFGKLQKLAILQLHKNSLSGPVPAELGSCNSLVWLDLSSNNFSGAIPPQLAAQAGLTTGGVVSGKRIAFLRSEVGNICPGAGVLFEFFGIRTERLAQLPAVRSCAPTGIYTGTIFYTFNSNGSMIFLDLSYNHLTGTIPTSLGNMAYLDVLNLGHNELTGEIPGAFTGLEEIALLDLSHNQLSGTIPPGFGGLHFLAAFDVSNNNLAGEIPTSGQLMTFPASGFENNSGLCGIPLPPCRGIDNKGGGDLVPEDIRDGHEPVVSPSGLGIGVAFGVPVGFGLGILLL